MGGLLRVHDLCKTYGRESGLVRAVDDVDLDVAAGETLAVMGPSGCGKSTLLHLLGGLDRPTSGEVWLAGQRVDTMSERSMAALRRDRVGFVFQAFHLMDELTAAENIELPALLAGRSPRTARRRALDLLDRVGLTDRARICPPSSPAVSGSGWRSRGRWSTNPSWYWPTSRPETSTARRPSTSCACSRSCTRLVRRWSS